MLRGLRRLRRAGDGTDLRRELQECRLALAERERTVARLQGDLDRARGSAQDEAARRGRARVLELVESMGAPLVQLATQAELHRGGTVQVRTDDVVGTGTRLLRSLRDAGVATVGEVGERAGFDPDRHDPLSTAGQPAAGAPVVVRVVGLSYLDRVVRRAGVEPVATDGVA